MNQKTPYELQIAGKLQQLPLPDLEDAIWARIERTLDTDLPTDDGGPGDPAPDAPWWGSGGVGGFVFSMVFVAALSTFVLYKSLNSSNKAPVPQSTPTNEVLLPQSDEAQPPPGTVVLPPRQAPRRTTAPTPIAGDSALAQPLVVTPPPVPDTAATSTAIVSPPTQTSPNQPSDTTAPRRRPRGAQGISPGDYRIVPRRDSTGQ